MAENFADEVGEYYGAVYRAILEGRLDNARAFGMIPPILLELLVGTPDRSGMAAERYLPFSPRDPFLPMYEVVSMACAVVTMAHTGQVLVEPRLIQLAVEYHWRRLRGFMSSAASANEPVFWIKALVRYEGLEDLVCEALRVGGQFTSRTWQQNVNETTISIKMLVHKFQSLCHLARELPPVRIDENS